MHDANWWLIGLAFVLGLLLTFAPMIRRVTREVPVGGAAAEPAGVPAGGDAPTTRTHTGGEEATTRIPTAGRDDTSATKRPPPSQAETTRMPVADETQTQRRQGEQN
ncbi:hypothetical protein [uncultured Mycobacterium sp.]|uniref:channel accessory protein ArfC n=1 Tax=uncultured Mycobacterium sp. TaxID=171292 RepID=UPI0035CBEAD2